MLTGAADRAVELSSEYGNEREQYGQPIGMFQAVKHRAADMWIDMQSARSLVYYASWALDNDEPDAGRAVAATKSHAADRLHRVFADDMKTTAEWALRGITMHTFTSNRPRAGGTSFGSPEAYRDRLIESRLAESE